MYLSLYFASNIIGRHSVTDVTATYLRWAELASERSHWLQLVLFLSEENYFVKHRFTATTLKY
jgi:hypothetical protein